MKNLTGIFLLAAILITSIYLMAHASPGDDSKKDGEIDANTKAYIERAQKLLYSPMSAGLKKASCIGEVKMRARGDSDEVSFRFLFTWEADKGRPRGTLESESPAELSGLKQMGVNEQVLAAMFEGFELSAMISGETVSMTREKELTLISMTGNKEGLTGIAFDKKYLPAEIRREKKPGRMGGPTVEKLTLERIAQQFMVVKHRYEIDTPRGKIDVNYRAEPVKEKEFTLWKKFSMEGGAGMGAISSIKIEFSDFKLNEGIVKDPR